MPPSQMTLHVLTHGSPVRAGRQTFLSPAARNSPPSRIKVFFDELINIPPALNDDGTQPNTPRSRLIYVRDYPTLAASASTWYPALLSAVRQRRQGPMARPSSPISNSMTIIFGVTPSIVPPSGSSGSHGIGGPQSLLGLIMSRQSTSTLPGFPNRTAKNDYGEDDVADRARERRLRERLRKWERGDPSLQDELPNLPHMSGDSSGPEGAHPRSGIVIVGPSGVGGVPPGLASAIQARSGGRGEEYENNARFFRSSVLVPTARSLPQERACRVSRRREINELTMRMGVGAVGGALQEVLRSPSEEATEATIGAEEGEMVGKEKPPKSDSVKMWDEWGAQIEAWTNVKDIADRAVGSVVASGAFDVTLTSRSALEPTPISWAAVVTAWAARRSSRDVRRAWIQQSSGRSVKEQQEDDDDDGEDEAGEDEEAHRDEVVQQIKQDPDLTPHEQRLLGCIIDSGQ